MSNLQCLSLEQTDHHKGQNQINPCSYSQHTPFKISDLLEGSEIPDTISSNWLPMISLKLEYRFNSKYVDNINNIQKKYVGWRKVRGDGNCYYRSVISSYLLKIFHYQQYEDRAFNLIKTLQNIPDNFPEDFVRAKYQVNRKLYEFYDALKNKADTRTNIFKNLNNLLLDKNFDLNLVMCARLITHYSLTTSHKDELAPFMTEDEMSTTLMRILRIGTEAEGVELSACPLGLNIIVRQYNLFEGVLCSFFPFTPTGNEYATVNIISKSKGHYDLLYSIEDMENESFCFLEGVYYIEKN